MRHRCCCEPEIQVGTIAVALLEMQHAITEMKEMITEMGAREEAADARQLELIGLVRDGWLSLQAENRVLRDQLAQAGADQEAAVAAALEADSDFDAGKKEQANVALEELITPAPEPQPEPEPEPSPEPAPEG